MHLLGFFCVFFFKGQRSRCGNLMLSHLDPVIWPSLSLFLYIYISPGRLVAGPVALCSSRSKAIIYNTEQSEITCAYFRTAVFAAKNRTTSINFANGCGIEPLPAFGVLMFTGHGMFILNYKY